MNLLTREYDRVARPMRAPQGGDMGGDLPLEEELPDDMAGRRHTLVPNRIAVRSVFWKEAVPRNAPSKCG